ASVTALPAGLYVDPAILNARIVIDAVRVLAMYLHVRLPAGIGDAVRYDWIGDVLGELAFDCPDELLAQAGVGFLRLGIEELLHLGVAILGEVILRIAGVILLEHGIGVVDGRPGQIEADGVI